MDVKSKAIILLTLIVTATAVEPLGQSISGRTRRSVSTPESEPTSSWSTLGSAVQSLVENQDFIDVVHDMYENFKNRPESRQSGFIEEIASLAFRILDYIPATIMGAMASLGGMRMARFVRERRRSNGADRIDGPTNLADALLSLDAEQTEAYKAELEAEQQELHSDSSPTDVAAVINNALLPIGGEGGSFFEGVFSPVRDFFSNPARQGMILPIAAVIASGLGAAAFLAPSVLLPRSDIFGRGNRKQDKTKRGGARGKAGGKDSGPEEYDDYAPVVHHPPSTGYGPLRYGEYYGSAAKGRTKKLPVGVPVVDYIPYAKPSKNFHIGRRKKQPITIIQQEPYTASGPGNAYGVPLTYSEPITAYAPPSGTGQELSGYAGIPATGYQEPNGIEQPVVGAQTISYPEKNERTSENFVSPVASNQEIKNSELRIETLESKPVVLVLATW
ncbi:unnamed protein product [Cyprideis torosa]|uniref:Uncharacterized protein n=1 Tax=Cyprideis torosa TaxID=163714 RepID=A0A7R8ZQF8_9CRUS|nr:unnamed protein product [Cyprideis torosa]CAG0890572.1 unnamed protein product [Cyprideis torosa]